jgi:antitoxin VbhA-like protein
MTISDKERILRLKAVQSALASVQLSGLHPSQHLEDLLAYWVDGDSTLDQIHAALLAKVKTNND